VEVGSNLGTRSNQLLFTVTAPVPSYWRLTALDQYDANAGIWVLSNSYDAVDGRLRDPGGDKVYDTQVTVAGLGGFWIPTAPDPVQATSSVPLSWDASSGSLIARGQDIATGDTFAVTAAVPVTDRQRLEAARPPRGVDPRLLDATGVPASLAAEADRVAGTLAPYEQALALQDWFRTAFAYDDTADFSSSPDPLEEFMQQRRGFCQQFSSAFALGARSLGLPTRVVVGFTPGDAEARPGGGDRFDVRGRHAHAWPEVLFDGLGWVPFEPTPGRGDPSTTAITGVDGAQAAPGGADAPVQQVTTTSAPPSTVARGARPGTPGTTPGQSVTAGAPAAQETGSPAGWWPWVAAVVAALVVTAVLWWRRRRAAGGGADRRAPDAVAEAWRSTLRRLERTGRRPDAGETPNEFARRVAADLGRADGGGRGRGDGGGADDGAAAHDLVLLARLESARRWSGVAPDGATLRAAAAAAARLSAAIDAGERVPEPVG